MRQILMLTLLCLLMPFRHYADAYAASLTLFSHADAALLIRRLPPLFRLLPFAAHAAAADIDDYDFVTLFYHAPFATFIRIDAISPPLLRLMRCAPAYAMPFTPLLMLRLPA